MSSFIGGSRRWSVLVFTSLGLFLVACGGGDDPDGGEAGSGPGQDAARPGEARIPDAHLGSLERPNLGLTLPWTVGEVNRDPTSGSGRATVRSVELEALPGADRILVTFDSAGVVPGYRIAGTIEPLRACATGDTIPVQNAALLQIRLRDTWTADGVETPSVDGSDLANVRTMESACDEEGTVEWVLSVESATFYRAVEASSPPRLAVDVQHPEEDPDEGPGEAGGGF